MPVEIIYSSGLRQREESGIRGCAIVGQLENLKCIKFDDISCKLPSSADEKVGTDYSFSIGLQSSICILHRALMKIIKMHASSAIVQSSAILCFSFMK